MKNIFLIVLFLLLNMTACVKDKNLIDPDPVGVSESPILINEVVSTGLPDWIELYNTSSETVDLGGYILADSGAEYAIPAGTNIDAGGYAIFLADKGNTVDAVGIHTNFKISSGGEVLKLKDNEGNLVDQLEVPPMEPELSWGRITDGNEEWSNMSPSPSAPNSNENYAPTLIADTIFAMTDNESLRYTITAVDASGIRDVKLFFQAGDDVYFVEMAPIGEGQFTYQLPYFADGDVVEYYVVASDETGKKSYFPETAPDLKLGFTVTNGAPLISNFSISTDAPAENDSVNVFIDVFDVTGLKNIRAYYVLNDGVADDAIEVDMDNTSGNTYVGVLPGQAIGTVVRYYLRAKDLDGNKAYFPATEEFDKENPATWLFFTVSAPAPLNALVINEIQGDGTPDFIELYNGTDTDINLAGYKIEDSDPAEAYTIPEGEVIPAGGFWTLDADGDVVTLFKIKKSGEDITLYNPDGEIVDQLLAENWPSDHLGLVGRIPDGTSHWAILDTETKGSSNGN